MLSHIANRPRLLVLTAVILLVTSSVAYGIVEDVGYDDALWFSIVTATTVGYGDVAPTTEAGRVVAGLLVVSMVLFFIPMVTAGFASKLIVNRDAFTHEEQEELKEALSLVLERLPKPDDG